LIPGFTRWEPVVERAKSSWRRHPEAFLPAATATLLENWHPPGGRSSVVLAAQAEMFQMAADSPSVLPGLGGWARYHAARIQFEQARGGRPESASASAACLENARRAAADTNAGARELRVFFGMARSLGDHGLGETLLNLWERRQPGDPEVLRNRVDLAMATGELAGALRHVDALAQRRPADPWAQRQRKIILSRLRELVISSPVSNTAPSHRQQP
jgi:hypothetical protein